MIPLTVAAAASIVTKSSRSVRTSGGFGVRRTATAVAIPIVPSLPTKQPAQVVARRVGLDAHRARRSCRRRGRLRPQARGRRDSRSRGSAGRRRWSRRCRRWCRPAATTDPARSGGRGARPPDSGRGSGRPGSTQATRSTGSISRIRFMCVVTITSGSSTGVAPPASPVPLPRATNERSWRAAIRTAAATSSAERGKHTAAASPTLDARHRVRTARARVVRLAGSVGAERGAARSRQRRCVDRRASIREGYRPS